MQIALNKILSPGYSGSLDTLIRSIRNCGLRTPIIVRQGDFGIYLIVDGHRRHAACVWLCWLTIECVVVDASVEVSKLRTRMTDAEMQKILSTTIPPTGWDNVKDGYCQGDWLIKWTGKHWMVHHPEKTRLGNLDFTTALKAAEWIGETFGH